MYATRPPISIHTMIYGGLSPLMVVLAAQQNNTLFLTLTTLQTVYWGAAILVEHYLYHKQWEKNNDN